jgi:hypothetical protein
MVAPQPGSIGYLNASRANAARAAKRLQSGQVTAGTPATDPSTLTTPTTTTTTTDPGLTTVPGTTP